MTSTLVFILRRPDGRREQLTVDTDRALVGSGAHCEIRLPVEHAATEHLAISARQGMVFGEARCFAPAPTVGGAAFTQGRLLPDSIVTLGSIELSISLMHVDGAASSKSSKPRKVRTRTYLLAALAIALACYVFVKAKRNDGLASAPPVVPDLWTSEKETCPQQDREPALALGHALRIAADGKRERSPFHPEDGVAAATLYRRGAACLAIAGQNAEFNEVSASADDMRNRVRDDFRVNRLRLERALASQDWGTTRKTIRILMGFLQNRSGDYVNWLSNIDRRITIKYAGQNGGTAK